MRREHIRREREALHGILQRAMFGVLLVRGEEESMTPKPKTGSERKVSQQFVEEFAANFRLHNTDKTGRFTPQGIDYAIETLRIATDDEIAMLANEFADIIEQLKRDLESA